MLLHIGCSSLKVGQKLLQIALGVGFRESGLIITNENKRITLAIRTASLNVSCPIMLIQQPCSARHDDTPEEQQQQQQQSLMFHVPIQYVHGLIEQSNQRLQTNWNQLNRLYQMIERTFFSLNKSIIISVRQRPAGLTNDDDDVHTTISPLNLWNATAILQPPVTGEQQEQQRRRSNNSNSRRGMDCWWIWLWTK